MDIYIYILPFTQAFFPTLSFSHPLDMDSLIIYAIAAGGTFVLLFLIKTAAFIAGKLHKVTVPLQRHLTLPVLFAHRPFGPWTRADVFLHFSYISINIFLVFFRASAIAGVGRRAGTLAVINLVLPLSTIHLSSLADLLDIHLQTCQKVHRATGWMAIVLLAIHAIIALVEGHRFPLSEPQNLYTVIVCSDLH